MKPDFDTLMKQVAELGASEVKKGQELLSKLKKDPVKNAASIKFMELAVGQEETALKAVQSSLPQADVPKKNFKEIVVGQAYIGPGDQGFRIVQKISQEENPRVQYEGTNKKKFVVSLALFSSWAVQRVNAYPNGHPYTPHSHCCPSCHFVWDHDPKEIPKDHCSAFDDAHHCKQCGTKQSHCYHGNLPSEANYNGVELKMYKPE